MNEVYRGYKGFNKDLKCRGMQYEVGKTYHQDGEIITCKNGLHFCKNMSDVFNYYDIDNGSRYCEVEAFGEIDFSLGDKFAASDIKIIRELSKTEINHCLYGGNFYYSNIGMFGDGACYGDGDGCGHGVGYGYGDGACYGYYKQGDGHNVGNGCGDGNGDGIVDYNIYSILIFEEV